MTALEILKEFIYQSLSPAHKAYLSINPSYINSYYNHDHNAIVFLRTEKYDCYIRCENNILYIWKYEDDPDVYGHGHEIRKVINLADPKASEKIREFLEEGYI